MSLDEKLEVARAWMLENHKLRQRSMFGRRRHLTPDWLRRKP